MRGADLLVKALALAGVERIFTLSGNQIMPVFDACLDAGIELIHTRHEAAAVFMADAYAQLTGLPGVCLVTAAPGAANAVGPLFSARHSESPVLLLTGDSPLSQDGSGAFQELDQVSVMTAVTKCSRRASDAERLGHDVAEAIRLATSGRPGPAHLALPFDLVQADVREESLPGRDAFRRTCQRLEAGDLLAVKDLLKAASAPLVLCGPALNRTRSPVEPGLLSAALDAPVLALESPRGLNDPSLGGFKKALLEADLVVCLGKSVNFTLGFGAQAHRADASRWIMIDADPNEHQRARRNLGADLTMSLTADPRDAAVQLSEASSNDTHRAAWREKVAGLVAARSSPKPHSQSTGIVTPAVLSQAVQNQLDLADDPVLICDGGEFGQWAQAGTSARQRIINGASGAIGGALAYAIAACKARPQSLVVAMMGDGTVGFHLAEFETAVREQTPLVAVVGNDACWNAEHQIQLRDYGPERLIGCQLSAARYDLVAAALGGHGEYVTKPEQLEAALQRAIQSGLPACVNVMMVGAPAPAAP